MTAILIIGVIALGIAAFIWQTNRGTEGDSNARRWGMIGSLVAVIVIVVSLIFSSFTKPH